MMQLIVIPALAGSEMILTPFLDALPPYLDVTVIEPPGFGDAPSPTGVPSVRELALAALSSWDKAGVGRAHLFGISLGGMIAQWMALEAPELVDRLILTSTTDTGLSAIIHADLRYLAVARCLLHPEADVTAELAADILNHNATDEITAHVDHAAHVQARSKLDLVWLGAAAASHNARDRLGEIQSKTLILSGGADDLIPATVQAEMGDRIRDTTHVVLDGVGHDVTLEAPDETAAAVSTFLMST